MLHNIKRHVKKYRKTLFIRVFISYGAMLMLFAVLLSLILIRLFTTSMNRYYKNQLETQAEKIRESFEGYIDSNDNEGCLSYLETLSEAGTFEVWSISNPYSASPMSSSISNIELFDIDVRERYIKLILDAFKGRQETMTAYSHIHGSTMMFIGVPLHESTDNICGCLLISTPLSVRDDIMLSSRNTLIISMLLSLVAAFLIAFIFARQLVIPITKMRKNAIMLANGHYDAKNQITRSDELGDLGRTLDFLADKLAENDKLRKELEQTRLDFFANVSHELRTPITVVRAYTESLVDGVVTGPEKTAQYYDRMLAECKSMERLVSDLLILSKMQNPDFSIETEPVSICDIFDEITKTGNTLGADKKITIHFVNKCGPAMVYGDYDRLRQMFLVIFDNAIKFSPENSSVCVTIRPAEQNEISKIKRELVKEEIPGKIENKPVRVSQEYMSVSILDHGIGIAPDELPYIFDKFYKSKLRQNAKGSGLGLAIARQIAYKHGGGIIVKSKQSEGSEFIFILPSISINELNKLNG